MTMFQEPGSYMSTQRSFTPGWNDPPVLSSITKPACVNRKPAVVPIMHPLFDVSHTQRPSEEYHQKGDLAHQPYFRNPQAESTPSVCPLPPLQLAREALPLPTKRPLPEEHMHIQTVCDELRQRVYNTATNPSI
ncbi:protein transport protein Sec31A [Diaphorina citri]|uniref:Protein transport protein Sec31A n=1 Tax=Diaphorina citri TaxID=121845 RepID=A0A1S3DBB4_DIACI|nr:protein transport protein Sec31A [Diaphorina citri]